MLPIVFLAVYKLSNIMIEKTGDITNEPVIQQSLKRAGMRKSVELYQHAFLTITLSLILFPPVILMTVHYVFQHSISVGYFTFITLIFVLNSISQYHMVTFALPEKYATRVNKILEIAAILCMI